MAVDGLVDPVFFEIRPDTDRDRYIKTVQFTIVDQNATLTQFGNIGALDFPILFEWDRLGETVLLATMISNYDHVRLSGGDPPFGDGTAPLRDSDGRGTAEAYVPVMDYERMCGLPGGIRLGAGSDEVLRITIEDDITGVDGYDAIARGFEIEPEQAQAGLGM